MAETVTVTIEVRRGFYAEDEANLRSQVRQYLIDAHLEDARAWWRDADAIDAGVEQGPSA